MNISIAADDLKVSVSKLVNPILATDCSNLEKTDLYYDIKLIDMQEHEIVASTSPSIDDKNCIPFKKGQFNVIPSGPSVLQRGLSFPFILSLEQPANGLRIKPVSSINGINFSPETLAFDDFAENK